MASILIKGGQIVNRGSITTADVYIKNGLIEQIEDEITRKADTEIDAEGKFVIPGIIDDQVHFREPGLTHKADLYTESRAAVAGGVTTFMEMPNTKPPTLTQELLEAKYLRASSRSLANFSFYMGASNDNLEQVLRTDPRRVCGVKVFMGSSTGNMLVDDEKALEGLFSKVPLLIATHCEDEHTIRDNEAKARQKYGEEVPMAMHPQIRSIEACLKSSSLAVQLAKEYGTRLHILHITTEEELDLFEKGGDLATKRITSEACVHHLYFSADDYEEKGSRIKCNPAIKASRHREAVWQAVLEDRIDVIATDHAPHTWKEKQNSYFQCPSGLPLVQHALNIMLEFYHQDKISMERIVEKMCHAPAELFQIDRRGYLEEGYWADLAVVDPNAEWNVLPENLEYKCRWSPFEGHTFRGKVDQTIVGGHLVYDQGLFDEEQKGRRVTFKR